MNRRHLITVCCTLALAAAGCQIIVGIQNSPPEIIISNGDAASPTEAAIDAPRDTGIDATVDQGGGDTGAGQNGDAEDSAHADANVDAGVDAQADADAAPPECVGDASRCEGNVPQTCSSGGTWVDAQACDAFCQSGKCIAPPSCSGIVTTCGSSVDPRDCCSAHLVPGGSFIRDYDNLTAGHTNPTYTATVSDFILDDFEVTVERFQHFVDAYPTSADAGATSLPAPNSGRNINDPNDHGWVATWPLPATRSALVSLLQTGILCDHPTWGGGSIHQPITCATWYLAYAFCIWDGGRLPTEAEWNFAAAGGGGADGQRVYPWSNTTSPQSIGPNDAVYNGATLPPVGSKLPAGAGRWNQADLAGSVSEWLADAYVSPYATNPCIDCADHTLGLNRALRGGNFLSDGAGVHVAKRDSSPPAYGLGIAGFRCARSK